jgi:hypothetical protein
MDVAVNLGDLQRLQWLAATKARVENKLTGFAEQPQPPPDCRQTVPVMKGDVEQLSAALRGAGLTYCVTWQSLVE